MKLLNLFKLINFKNGALYCYLSPMFFGGGPSATTSTVNQSTIPDWAAPYAKAMYGAATQQIFNTTPSGDITGIKGYTPYSSTPSDYVAGFAPLQTQSQQDASNLGNAGTQAGDYLQKTLTSPQAMQQYINPYVQSALEPQLNLLSQQYGKQNAALEANASEIGGFTNSRLGVEQGLNTQAEDLAKQKAIGEGYNQAYGQAQQAAQQAGAQGLQGVQEQQGIIGLQNTMGAQQQNQQQNIINQAVQNYATGQQYPYQQLSMYNSLLRGFAAPTTASTTYTAQPNAMSQMTGVLGAGIGAYKAFGAAEGGTINESEVVSHNSDMEAAIREEIARLQADMSKGAIPAYAAIAKINQLTHELTVARQAKGESLRPNPTVASQVLGQNAPEASGINEVATNFTPEMAKGGIIAFDEGGPVGDYRSLADKLKDEYAQKTIKALQKENELAARAPDRFRIPKLYGNQVSGEPYQGGITNAPAVRPYDPNFVFYKEPLAAASNIEEAIAKQNAEKAKFSPELRAGEERTPESIAKKREGIRAKYNIPNPQSKPIAEPSVGQQSWEAPTSQAFKNINLGLGALSKLGGRMIVPLAIGQAAYEAFPAYRDAYQKEGIPGILSQAKKNIITSTGPQIYPNPADNESLPEATNKTPDLGQLSSNSADMTADIFPYLQQAGAFDELSGQLPVTENTDNQPAEQNQGNYAENTSDQSIEQSPDNYTENTFYSPSAQSSTSFSATQPYYDQVRQGDNGGIRGIEDYMKEYNQYVGDNKSQPKLANKLAEMEAETTRDKERAPWLALMNAGIGMMAARSPYALTNIGEGAREGMQSYDKEMQSIHAKKDRQFAIESQLDQAIRNEDVAKFLYGANSRQAQEALQNHLRIAQIQGDIHKSQIANQRQIAQQELDQRLGIAQLNHNLQIKKMEDDDYKQGIAERRVNLAEEKQDNANRINGLNELIRSAENNLKQLMPGDPYIALYQSELKSARNQLKKLIGMEDPLPASTLPATYENMQQFYKR